MKVITTRRLRGSAFRRGVGPIVITESFTGPDYDLDALIAAAAAAIAEGRDPGPMQVEVSGCDTVSWTGVSGVTQRRDVRRDTAWSYAVQARDYACVLTDGRVPSA